MTVVAGGDALAQDIIKSTALYAAATGSANAFVVGLPTAPDVYTAGMVINFKANFTITGATTVNINSLGAKTIKKHGDQDLESGDIENGQLVTIIYDGTNFQMVSISGNRYLAQDGKEIYAASSGGSDSYAVTLSPAPGAYVTGMVVRFKADVANTGPATLNVNSLGAKTIKKYVSTDLENNDIKADQILEVIYDGTNFQLLSPLGLIPQSRTVFVHAGSIVTGNSGAVYTRGLSSETLGVVGFADGQIGIALAPVVVPPGCTSISSIKVAYIRAHTGNLYLQFYSARVDLDSLPTTTQEDTTDSLTTYAGGASDSTIGTITVPSASYNGLTMDEGDLVTLKIYRDANDATDTYAAEWKVVGVEFIFT